MGIGLVFLIFCLMAASAYRLIGQVKGDANKNLALYLLVFLVLAAVIGMVRTCNLLPFVPSMAVPFVAYGPKLIIGYMISLGAIAGLGSNSGWQSSHPSPDFPGQQTND